MKTLEQIIKRAKELNNTIKLLESEIKDVNFQQSIKEFNNNKIENINGQLQGLCFASGLRVVEFLRITSNK
tara:strand:- start:273 stop:485 length:213 start_codon:yes stop_codon:yes gene_type:complete